MRKKLAILAFALAAVAPTAAIPSASAGRPAPFAPIAAKSCPPGTHLWVCGTASYFCANNALCVCS